jgi:hypothetical protein
MLAWSWEGRGGERNVQESVDGAHEHDTSTEPAVRDGELCRLLGLLPLSVVEEAKDELGEEEDEDDDSEDLVRAAEFAGLYGVSAFID